MDVVNRYIFLVVFLLEIFKDFFDEKIRFLFELKVFIDSKSRDLNFNVIFLSLKLKLNILFIIFNSDSNLFIINDNNENIVCIICIYPPTLEKISDIFQYVLI